MEKIIIDHLKKLNSQISIIYLFGSQADGTATKQSDVDIAFYASEILDKKDIWDTKQTLELVLSKDIDLIQLNHAPMTLREQVVTQGKCIYCEDVNLRENMELVWLRMALDFNDYRKPLVDQIKKEGIIYG